MTLKTTEEGLQRVIGLSSLTFAIISGVIGAGIFVLPAIVGMKLGAYGIFGYIFCGILFASIMLCYAEIGSRVTTSGGSYAYIEAAFGDFAGYISNWMYTFAWGIIGSAAVMNILADSLAVVFPVFIDPLMRGILFFTMIAFMILINVLGAKQSVGLVKIITIVKLLPLFGIIIFGFSHINKTNFNWDHFPSIGTFGEATLILFFAFMGFDTLLGASGEIINPKRNIPLGIFLAGLVILIVYLLLQIVVQGILGPNLATFKDAPLAAVANSIIGSQGAVVLLLCAALSCFGNVLLDILCTPRVLFAGANDGLFPKYLSRLHPIYATPYLAVITYGLLIFLFATFGGFQQLAIMASAVSLLIYLAVIFALLKLRLRKTESNEGYFKAPGGILTPLIGIVAIISLLACLSKWEILSTLIFIAVVAIIYFFKTRVKREML